MNRRTLHRDPKMLVEKGLVRENGTGPTDPTKHYEAATVTSYDRRL